jgi:hypothetical protein
MGYFRLSIEILRYLFILLFKFTPFTPSGASVCTSREHTVAPGLKPNCTTMNIHQAQEVPQEEAAADVQGQAVLTNALILAALWGQLDRQGK